VTCRWTRYRRVSQILILIHDLWNTVRIPARFREAYNIRYTRSGADIFSLIPVIQKPSAPGFWRPMSGLLAAICPQFVAITCRLHSAAVKLICKSLKPERQLQILGAFGVIALPHKCISSTVHSL